MPLWRPPQSVSDQAVLFGFRGGLALFSNDFGLNNNIVLLGS